MYMNTITPITMSLIIYRTIVRCPLHRRNETCHGRKRHCVGLCLSLDFPFVVHDVIVAFWGYPSV